MQIGKSILLSADSSTLSPRFTMLSLRPIEWRERINSRSLPNTRQNQLARTSAHRQRTGKCPCYHSSPARPRCRFNWDRWRLSASRRSRAALGTLVFLRTRGGWARRLRIDAIFCRQSWRFWNWLRVSRAVTVMPVGTCVMRTAESVVFTPWPPGPFDRNTCTSQSRASSSILC